MTEDHDENKATIEAAAPKTRKAKTPTGEATLTPATPAATAGVSFLSPKEATPLEHLKRKGPKNRPN